MKKKLINIFFGEALFPGNLYWWMLLLTILGLGLYIEVCIC